MEILAGSQGSHGVVETMTPKGENRGFWFIRLIRAIWEQFSCLIRKILCLSKRGHDTSSSCLPASSVFNVTYRENSDGPRYTHPSPPVKTPSSSTKTATKPTEATINGEVWDVQNQEEVKGKIAQLKPLVNPAREAIKLSGSPLDLETIKPLLEEEFDVVYVDDEELQVCPKMIKSEENGTILHFRDGTILSILKGFATRFKGERTFPDGTVEQGEFFKSPPFKGGLYIFNQGTRVEGENVTYIFPADQLPTVDKEGSWFSQQKKGVQVDCRVVSKTSHIFECIKGKRIQSFRPYTVQKEGVFYTLGTLEQEGKWIQGLRDEVRRTHQQFQIGLPDQSYSQKDSYCAAIGLLKEHFEVATLSNSFVRIGPKIARREIEGKKTITHFVDGTTSEFEVDRGFFKGKRTKGGVVEEGRFGREGASILLEGTITDTISNTVLYVFPTRFFSKKQINETLQHIPDPQGGEGQWRVFTIQKEDPVSRSIVCELNLTKTPLQVVLEHLRESLSEITQMVGLKILSSEDYKTVVLKYFDPSPGKSKPYAFSCAFSSEIFRRVQEALSIEEQRQILPKYFTSSADGRDPPIFSFTRSLSQRILKLAGKLGVSLDLSIKNKEGVPFFILALRDCLEKDDPQKHFRILCGAGSHLLATEGDAIFEELLKLKSRWVKDLDFSGFTLSPKNQLINQLIYDVLSKDYSQDMLDRFEAAAPEEQALLVQLGDRFNKEEFLKGIDVKYGENIAWCIPELIVPPGIAENPVNPDLCGALFPMKRRNQRVAAMTQVLKDLAKEGTFVAVKDRCIDLDEYIEDLDEYIEWGYYRMEPVLGRRFLQPVIDALGLAETIKVPQIKVLIDKGTESLSCTMRQFHLSISHISVYMEKVQKSEGSPTFDQVKGLICLLEAVGYSIGEDKSPSDVLKDIVYSGNSLYFLDTSHGKFTPRPAYHLLRYIGKKLLKANEDREAMAAFIEGKRAQYEKIRDKIEEYNNKRMQIEKKWEELYGMKHEFTLSLSQLGLSSTP